MDESANRKIDYNLLEGFIVLRPLGDRVIIEVAKEEEKTRYRSVLWENKEA